MTESKKFKVNLEGDLSKQTKKWADLLGLDLEGNESDDTLNQYINQHVAEVMEHLKNENEEQDPT